MRVFLDTNVLVSAIATRGLASDVFRLVLVKHDFIAAEPVLVEVEGVLKQKFGLQPTAVAASLRFLRRFPVEPMPSTPSDVKITDPDDAWILAAAIQADADVLIAGDAAFLAVSKQVGRPRIISPRGFWEMHRGFAP